MGSSPITHLKNKFNNLLLKKNMTISNQFLLNFELFPPLNLSLLKTKKKYLKFWGVAIQNNINYNKNKHVSFYTGLKSYYSFDFIQQRLKLTNFDKMLILSDFKDINFFYPTNKNYVFLKFSSRYSS